LLGSLKDLKISRRDFVKLGISAALLAALDWKHVIRVFAKSGAPFEIPIIWFESQDCAGDTTSIIQAVDPDLVDVLAGFTSAVGPGSVKLLFHETVMIEFGEYSLEILRAATEGKELNPLELAKESPFGKYYVELVEAGVIPKEHAVVDFSKGYVLVLEGSFPICSTKPGSEVVCMGRNEALYCYIGEEHGEFITCTEWVRRLLPKALAVVAVGSCAAYGGIRSNKVLESPPGFKSMLGNVTNAVGFFPDPVRGQPGLVDLLDTAEPFRKFVYSYGKCAVGKECKPALAVPGCPANGEGILRTLVAMVLAVKGLLPLPDIDQYWRPKFIFGATVHEQCPRAASYAAGDLRRSPGDPDYRCVFSVGCKGPIANCPWNKLGWVNGIGGPTRTGGVCIGCTMPGFSDSFEPFWKPLPAPEPLGVSATGAISAAAVVGGALVAYGLSKLHEKHVKEIEKKMEESK